MVMKVKLEQPEKQELPNETTEDGMVMLVKLEQPSKQRLPIEVTEDGMVMLVKREQCQKQVLPSETIEDGMVMLVKLEQYLKQELPNEVTEDGMMTLVKLEQKEKHSFPNEVTEDGMVMLLSCPHSLKQLSPNAVTGYSFSSFAFTFSGTTISPEYSPSEFATKVAFFAFSSIKYRKPSMFSKCAWARTLLVANIITTIKNKPLREANLPESFVLGGKELHIHNQ